MRLVDFGNLRDNFEKSLSKSVSVYSDQSLNTYSIFSREKKVREEVNELEENLDEKKKQLKQIDGLVELKKFELKDLENKLDLTYEQIENLYKYMENK